jgi:hypothetical protein
MRRKALAISLAFIVIQVKAESAYLGAALTKVNACYYRVKLDHKGSETLKVCAEADAFLKKNISNIGRDSKGDDWTKADEENLKKLSSRDKQNRLTLGTYRPAASRSDMKELGLVAIYSRFCNKAIKASRSDAISDKHCKSFVEEYSKNYNAILEKKDSKEGFTEVDNENWIKVTQTNDTIKSLK